MEPRGEGGFGYDPLFILPEYGMTYAELSAEVKRATSHRARALRKLIPWLVVRNWPTRSRKRSGWALKWSAKSITAIRLHTASQNISTKPR